MNNAQGDKAFLQPKSEYYRYCYVPSCKNTTITAPNKLFVCVPTVKAKRRAWLMAAGYPEDYKSSGARFCCEDHLDLKNDIENYRELEFHGGGSKRLRQGVVPRFNMTKPTDSANNSTAMEPEEDVTLGIGICSDEENANFTEDDMDEARNSEFNVDNLSTSGFAFVGVSLNDVRVCTDDPGIKKGTCEKWTQTEEKQYESKHVQAKPQTRVKIMQTARSTRDKCV